MSRQRRGEDKALPSLIVAIMAAAGALPDAAQLCDSPWGTPGVTRSLDEVTGHMLPPDGSVAAAAAAAGQDDRK
ncbi:hypothetical protein [Dactylosporangium roseum]|uniref:hypothetical protein n=1 Tax=Dactylosporangium roseum TaxID=47989 RepID=UPI0031E2262E